MLSRCGVGLGGVTGGGNPYDIITSIFADGTDGFYFDFSRTDRLWQTSSALAPADDPGESIGLAVEASRLDGRGIINRLIRTDEFNTSWTRRGTCTVTANADGVADLIAGLAGSGNDLFQQVTIPNSTAYRPSVEIKKVTSTGILSINNPFGPTSGSWTVDFSLLGSGYERITAEHPAVTISNATVSSAGGQAGIFFFCLTGAPLSFYVRSSQVETGASSTAYQANTATLGGPGNHGLQTTASAQPKYQTGGLARFDGTDDNLLTTLNPAASFSMLFKGKITSASKIVMGSRATTDTRSFIGTDASGLLSAGVGADSTTTIKGGSDIRGTPGVGGLVYSSGGVVLYWNGAQIYSGVLNGTPNTSIPLRVGCFNDNATASTFADIDIYHALAIKKALTAAQIASITNKWGTT